MSGRVVSYAVPFEPGEWVGEFRFSDDLLRAEVRDGTFLVWVREGSPGGGRRARQLYIARDDSGVPEKATEYVDTVTLSGMDFHVFAEGSGE